MARAATSRKRNIPGFGWLTKKETTYKRSRGQASHSSQAYRAGVKSGDTAGFESWLQRVGLSRAPRDIQKRLEDQYRRGVERAGDAERVKAARAERAAQKKERKQTALSSYKGVKLYKLGGGEYTTAIDRESRFDSLQDAKDFIASWKQNPAGCARTLKTNVSDRAKRYRANQPGCKPAGAKKCKICGSKRFLTVDHVDGNESNGTKRNLRWLCKSCNTRLGAEMAQSGIGRRTQQYNPGAETFAQYARAVAIHGSHYVPGVGRVGDHDEGGAIIHATPKSKRREFASQIWGSRYAKERGNPEASTEYRLGYNIGQMDRQSAQLRKTPGELYVIFGANFGGQHPDRIEQFAHAYGVGYGEPAALPNPCTSRSRANPTKRNQADAGDNSEEYRQAVKTAELFHGRPVVEHITITENIKEHDWYVRIGPLVSLVVKPLTKKPRPSTKLPFHQAEKTMVHMFVSPDGRQFYLRGGDQELDLEAFGMGPKTRWFRDRMVIGELKEITYEDRKKFHKLKPTQYFHHLGEETKVKPWLMYDAMNKKLEILGGQYHVEMEDLVEDMSPGIVN